MRCEPTCLTGIFEKKKKKKGLPVKLSNTGLRVNH